MAKTKNKGKFSVEEIFEEIKMLSAKAQENTSKQLDLLSTMPLGDEDIDIDNGFDIRILAGTANPDTSHKLYYTMRRTMMDNLPKGLNNKKLRQYVYSEKSLFLNRGMDIQPDGRKGSDERQAYIENFLQTAFDIVHNWVKNGANPFDLYMDFWNINDEKGYHEKKNNATNETEYDNKLKILLNVPPPKKS